jgi:DHA2 family methylenomycin A resistance protein-like MFS transporter
MLPLSLFRSRPFAAATAIGLLINIGFYGLIFVLSLYFQRAQGLSSLHTGLAFAPMTIVVMGSNILAGRLAGRIGARPVVVAGAVLMAASLAALLGAGTRTPYSELVAQLMGIGFGIGLIVPVITATVLGSVERSRSGIAAGTLNTARQTGSAIGVALYGSLVAGGQLVSGFHVSLVISVALALLVALLAGPLGRD